MRCSCRRGSAARGAEPLEAQLERALAGVEADGPGGESGGEQSGSFVRDERLEIGVTGVGVRTGDPPPFARLLAEGADTPCRTRQAAVAKHGGARLDAAREPAEQSDVVAGHAAPQGHRASASSVGLLALRIRFKT